MSAQLMLGRQQVMRSFSFTLGREFILLDPMDIVALTDANAGLENQWVRIKEITENDDRSLSIVAEEYLQGTGAAPQYGHQAPAPYVPNYNIAAPAALPPIFFDAPVQIGNALAMETILCTNGSGPNWGGCDVYLSSDNVTFAYAGTLYGGTVMGTLMANFPAGSDPDTADTLSVDLTESEGVHIIRAPRHCGMLSPIVHTIPVQLLAYHAALVKGTDVDKPRNLAKSVTVE